MATRYLNIFQRIAHKSQSLRRLRHFRPGICLRQFRARELIEDRLGRPECEANASGGLLKVLDRHDVGLEIVGLRIEHRTAVRGDAQASARPVLVFEDRLDLRRCKTVEGEREGFARRRADRRYLAVNASLDTSLAIRS